MTFILILGAVAGLWLLLRLASLALPVYAGLTVALFLLDAGFRYPWAILSGLGAAIATLITGRLIAVFVRLPLLRLLVGLLFALPAAFAGYHAGRAIIGLATTNDIALAAAGIIAGLSTAASAWRGIVQSNPYAGMANPAPNAPQPSGAGQLVHSGRVA